MSVQKAECMRHFMYVTVLCQFLHQNELQFIKAYPLLMIRDAALARNLLCLYCYKAIAG